MLVERDGQLSLAARGEPRRPREREGARRRTARGARPRDRRRAADRRRDRPLRSTTRWWPPSTDRSADAVLDALEAGTTAGLVEETDAGSHAFVHALVREAIYEQMGATRRRAAAPPRRGGARGLGRRRPRRAGAPLPRGRRPCQGARVLRGERAARARPARVRGRRRALRARARGARRRRPRTPLRAAASRSATRRPARATRRPRSAPTSRRPRSPSASALPERLGTRGARLRRAAAVGGLARRSRTSCRCSSARSPRSARRTARCASACSLGSAAVRCATPPDPRRRRAITSEALAAARRLGDPATLAYALDGYISAHHSPDHTVQQVELASELIDVALEAGDLERAIEAHEHRAAARLELGDLAGSAADVDGMAPLVADLRQPAQDWFLAERRAVQALHEGRLAEAEALIDDALRIGRDALPWSAAVCTWSSSSCCAGCRGGSPRSSRRRAPRPRSTRRPIRCAAARTCTCSRRSATTTRRARASRRSPPDRFAALKFDETWLAAVAFLAEAAHALGEAAHAEVLYERLAPYADRVAVSTPEVSLGAVVALPRPARRHLRATDDAAAHLDARRRRQHAHRRAAHAALCASRPRRADRRPRARRTGGRGVSRAGPRTSGPSAPRGWPARPSRGGRAARPRCTPPPRGRCESARRDGRARTRRAASADVAVTVARRA